MSSSHSTDIHSVLPVDIQHNKFRSLCFSAGEIQVVSSRDYDTEIPHPINTLSCRNQSYENAMPCHRTGYDKHKIHVL